MNNTLNRRGELLYSGLVILISGIFTFLIANFVKDVEFGFDNLDLLSLLLHNLGFAFGLGGALIALNVRVPKFKKFILVGFVLMTIVHVGELISEPEIIHMFKVLALVPIAIGGIYMGRLIHRLQKYKEIDQAKYALLEKRYNIVEMVVVAFWIADLVLNTIFLPSHGFHFLK